MEMQRTTIGATQSDTIARELQLALPSLIPSLGTLKNGSYLLAKSMKKCTPHSNTCWIKSFEENAD
ncbi:hypothetical protein T12_9880 [Trichinella patagoniensis]|uniref:Uncharacterized protein n=1 Tax=Trichinella patagoniensis TaxID=990121 RepID=A0A0V0YSR7_9BILA|nr:hypothetical protein T12_9880 [Trichinella patagoniensis]